MATATLIIGAENDIELGPPNGAALQDTATGLYPTDATVTGSLYTRSGAPVTNAQNITLSYVPGTTGSNTIYRGVIPHTAPLVEGVAYEFQALAIDTSGNRRPFNLACLAIKG